MIKQITETRALSPNSLWLLQQNACNIHVCHA